MALGNGQRASFACGYDGDGRSQHRQAINVKIFVEVQTKKVGSAAVWDRSVEQIVQAGHSAIRIDFREEIGFEGSSTQSDDLAADAFGFQTNFLFGGAERFSNGNELADFEAKWTIAAAGYQ